MHLFDYSDDPLFCFFNTTKYKNTVQSENAGLQIEEEMARKPKGLK